MDGAQLVGVRPRVAARSIYRRHDLLSEAAIYGEVTYDLTSRLAATAGGRWFATRVETHAGAFDIALAPLAPVNGRLTDQGLAPKLRLSFAATPEAGVYAQVQEGYRAGGVNTPPATGGAGARGTARFRPAPLLGFPPRPAPPPFAPAAVLQGR